MQKSLRRTGPRTAQRNYSDWEDDGQTKQIKGRLHDNAGQKTATVILSPVRVDTTLQCEVRSHRAARNDVVHINTYARTGEGGFSYATLCLLYSGDVA